MRQIHTLLTCYYNLADEGWNSGCNIHVLLTVHYHGNQTLQANMECANVAYSPVRCPDNTPPILHTTFESSLKWGGGLHSNIQLLSTIDLLQ